MSRPFGKSYAKLFTRCLIDGKGLNEMNVNGIACFGTGDGFSYCGQGYLEIKDRGVAAKFDLREYVDESSRSMTFVHTSRVVTLGRIGHCLDQRSRGGFYGVAVSVLTEELVDVSCVLELSAYLDEMVAAFRDNVFFDSQQIRGRLAHDDLRQISVFRPKRSKVTIEQESGTLEQRFAVDITGHQNEMPSLSNVIAASLIKPFGQGLNILSINHPNIKELRLPFDKVISAPSLIFTQAIKLRETSSALIGSLHNNVAELKNENHSKLQALDEALSKARRSYMKKEQGLEQKLSRRDEKIRQLERSIERLEQVGYASSPKEVLKGTTHNTRMVLTESVASNGYERDPRLEDRSAMASTGSIYSNFKSDANEYAEESSKGDLLSLRISRYQVISISVLLLILVALFLVPQLNQSEPDSSIKVVGSSPLDEVSVGESSAPQQAALEDFGEYKSVFRAARQEMVNYEAPTQFEQFLRAAIVELPKINQHEIPHFCERLLEYTKFNVRVSVGQPKQQGACIDAVEKSNLLESRK